MKNFLLFSSTSLFLQAYHQSDVFGKGIYLAIIAVSILSWILLINKTWYLKEARENARKFQGSIDLERGNPLIVEKEEEGKGPNPYQAIYLSLRKNTIDLLKKNHHVIGKTEKGSYLSPTDIDCIEASAATVIANQTKEMDKHLFLLSTIAGLAPLMGILGTVWGILVSFSFLQPQTEAVNNQMVLGGIALALTTTVLGILTAIPALVSYNYLKNCIRDFETDMEGFTNDLLSCIEMRFRKVDIGAQING